MHTFNQRFAQNCISSKGCFLISDAHILLLDSFMPSSFVSLSLFCPLEMGSLLLMRSNPLFLAELKLLTCGFYFSSLL